MNFVLYALLVVLVCVTIGMSLVAQDRRKREGQRIESRLRSAETALTTRDDGMQRAAASALLDAVEPIFFEQDRGWRFYVQLWSLVLLLAVGLLALGWGVAGATAEWQVRHAVSCRGIAQSTCIVRVPGTVVDKAIGRTANDLYVQTTAGTQDLLMWGDIHPVRVNEGVQVEVLGGTAVYVDTKEGMIEVNNYMLETVAGLIVGLWLPPATVFGLYLVIRWRRSYIEWRATVERFQRGEPRGIASATVDADLAE